MEFMADNYGNAFDKNNYEKSNTLDAVAGDAVMRDLLMIWTGMVLYRLIYEYLRLKRKAGER